MKIIIPSLAERIDTAAPTVQSRHTGDHRRTLQFDDALAGISSETLTEDPSEAETELRQPEGSKQRTDDGDETASELLLLLAATPAMPASAPRNGLPEQNAGTTQEPPETAGTPPFRTPAQPSAQEMVTSPELFQFLDEVEFGGCGVKTAAQAQTGTVTVDAKQREEVEQSTINTPLSIRRTNSIEPDKPPAAASGRLDAVETEGPILGQGKMEESVNAASIAVPASINFERLSVTAPNAPSPAAQILTKIAEASTPSHPSLLATQPSIQTVGDVRVLRIVLRPEALGEVDLTLRRAGADMRIHIAVTTAAAAEALQRDRSLLEERIGSLLPPGSQHYVTIVMQVPELREAPIPFPPMRSGADGSSPGFGGSADGGGGRSLPDKEEKPSRWKEREHNGDQTGRGRTGAGLVV